jgi:hypothetical protein
VSAVAMVTPADGPSFGTAPAGTWMWMSMFSKKSAGMPRRGARPDVAERRLRGLLHPVARLPVTVMPFRPDILVASMKMMSCHRRQTKPTAAALRCARRPRARSRPSSSRLFRRRDDDVGAASVARHLAADRADLSLDVSQAGFARSDG